MCGISVLCGFPQEMTVSSLENQSHRGPDESTLFALDYLGQGGFPLMAGFALLAVQGAEHDQRPAPEQPYDVNGDGRRVVLCNGEIYSIATGRENTDPSLSDCAVVPELLRAGYSHRDLGRLLDGDFAIVDIDLAAQTVTVLRDPYGCRPLFFAFYGPSQWAIASEIKGLPPGFLRVAPVAPGTVEVYYLDGSLAHTEVFHQVPWLKALPATVPRDTVTQLLRHSLVAAVQKRLAVGEGREIGACLSGGLDSSLVAALAAQAIFPARLHTFSVGMAGSEDMRNASLVAQHINSIHHAMILDPALCVADIPRVVGAIESCDVTTVRASVGNYNVGLLVSRVNAQDGLKIRVLLNGDGADEVLSGYLYTKAAPSDTASELDTVSLLENMHYFDVLRSERCMAAHGLEARSPFLDRQFVALASSVPTALLRNTPGQLEKRILRDAFAGTGLLPEAVLWRRKEAFSDGISGTDQSWYSVCRVAALATVGGPEEDAERRWYRQILQECYGEVAASCATPYYWMPKFVGDATDPSARTLALYTS